VTDRKYTVGLDPKILRESSILRYAIGPQVKAKEKIAAHAVKALTASFIAIPNDPLTLLEVLHVRSKRDDFSGEFVPWNQREPWTKFTLMDMEIGSAEPARIDSNQSIVVLDFRFRYILILESSGSVVNDSFHEVRKFWCNRKPARSGRGLNV
jgi:hypothetical protein